MELTALTDEALADRLAELVRRNALMGMSGSLTDDERTELGDVYRERDRRHPPIEKLAVGLSPASRPNVLIIDKLNGWFAVSIRPDADRIYETKATVFGEANARAVGRLLSGEAVLVTDYEGPVLGALAEAVAERDHMSFDDVKAYLDQHKQPWQAFGGPAVDDLEDATEHWLVHERAA